MKKKDIVLLVADCVRTAIITCIAYKVYRVVYDILDTILVVNEDKIFEKENK